MFALRIDLNGLEEALRFVERLGPALEAENLEASQRVAARVHAECKRLLQTEIYDIPIPLTADANRRLKPGSKVRQQTTKGRHGQWTRTGNLKRQETFTVEHHGQRVRITWRNHARYAAARNALGAEPALNPKGRKAGVQRAQRDVPEEERSRTRPVQWQREAVKRLHPWIREQYVALVPRAVARARR